MSSNSDSDHVDHVTSETCAVPLHSGQRDAIEVGTWNCPRCSLPEVFWNRKHFSKNYVCNVLVDRTEKEQHGQQNGIILNLPLSQAKINRIFAFYLDFTSYKVIYCIYSLSDNNIFVILVFLYQISKDHTSWIGFSWIFYSPMLWKINE